METVNLSHLRKSFLFRRFIVLCRHERFGDMNKAASKYAMSRFQFDAWPKRLIAFREIERNIAALKREYCTAQEAA